MTDTSRPMASDDPLNFDAVLRPHRSLSPIGFYGLMAGVVVVSFIAGLAFLLIGAWPVFGFFGLDVLLIYLAFRMSFRAAKLVERVQLSDGELLVWRQQPDGKVNHWRFQPYWVRVEIDEPAYHHSQLRLTSHGKSLVIGSFLTPKERVELAGALRDALTRHRAVPDHS